MTSFPAIPGYRAALRQPSVLASLLLPLQQGIDHARVDDCLEKTFGVEIETAPPCPWDQVLAPVCSLAWRVLLVARALMTRPKLMLIDEPSLGLAPLVVREIFRIVRELNEREGLTVLVVEQDARIALAAASSAYVLEVGRVALAGASAALREDDAVRRSYLGY